MMYLFNRWNRKLSLLVPILTPDSEDHHEIELLHFVLLIFRDSLLLRERERERFGSAW